MIEVYLSRNSEDTNAHGQISVSRLWEAPAVGTGATPRQLTRHLAGRDHKGRLLDITVLDKSEACRVQLRISCGVQKGMLAEGARSCQVGYTQVALALKTGGALETSV